MKYFQILLLLGINFSTILLGQSIEIPHRMMSQDTTINIPIFIYDVSELESIQLKIEYDETIILAEDIIENPLGILDGGYSFYTNVSDPGIIILVIINDSANLLSGSAPIAHITFESIGELGEFSELTFLDAQISSESVLGTAVDGSIEIVLDELTVTAVDQSGIGSDDFITLGMCETCTDGWRYGEDEYDNPNPSFGAYINLNFYHDDWIGAENGNICNCDPNCQNDDYNEPGFNAGCSDKFASDHRSQHSFRELTQWDIKVRWSDISDVAINLKWEPDSLITNSSNFKMFLYIGNSAGVDMQGQNSYTILQSELDFLNENNEPKIWVMLGECADTGETVTYYQDSDGDGLGSIVEGEFCEGLQPKGWVETNDEDECNGEEDCLGTCVGYAITDECGICDLDINNNNQCYDCNFEPNGGAILDNCGNCILEGENTACEMDCNGDWGGPDNIPDSGDEAIVDECNICGGNENNGNDICDIICPPNNEAPDCNGDCDGSATKDDCDICVGGTTGLDPCIPDCFGIPGGNAYLDECDVCGGDDTSCADCAGVPNGDYELDNCSTCDDDLSNDCQPDCSGTWGGTAEVDKCNTCNNDPSNNCIQDCNGDWGGYAFTDDCEVCDNDPSNDNQCEDCAEELYGEAYVDNCNECILVGENTTCEMDCNGDWGGPDNTPDSGDEAIVDECNICGGNENNGNDICDIICPPNNEAPDCNGDCPPIENCPDELSFTEGCAFKDTNCSDVCVGGATERDPCEQDCTGEWGGNSENDLCGICDADSGNNNQCVDCNGMVDGLAVLDNCSNCVEDLYDSSYECEQDCDGIWVADPTPDFICENGVLACNYDACFDLANNEYLLPQKFDINRIYPNPFNPQATIDYEVSEPTVVQLNIYNLKGQTVEVLINEFILPGYYSVIWNGTNHPSGIYFVILQSSNSIVKQKMMLIK